MAQTPREAAEALLSVLRVSVPATTHHRHCRDATEAAFVARDLALLEEKACTTDIELVSGAMGEGRAEGFKAGMEFALAVDEALIKAMAIALLDRRGFGFYTDPMEGGQDAYDISCDALNDAIAALATVRRHRRVE